MEFNEKFIVENVSDLAMKYDCIHGMNINLARITPDLIDGLKPVQRRIIWIMFQNDGGRNARKVASISGEVFGKCHPHSPTAIDDAIVKMAQSWRNMIPLITGLGNFGAENGAEAGASRYIQAKLSEFCIDVFFKDFKDANIEMELAYDEKTWTPLVLPSRIPIVLLNGCLGIGFGQSSNIPSFSLREIIEATILLMHRPNAKIVLIPDSTTGADIIQTDFAALCNRGCGSYSQRCTYEIDPVENKITITSLPELTTANDITDKIADIKLNKGLPELLSMNDLSGAKIEIELFIRDDINPYKFMKKLIKQVPGLQRSYPVNITVTNDYKSYDLSIKDLLLGWIAWRREYANVSLSNKRTRLTAELRAVDVKIFVMSKENLKKTIELFKNSKNKTEIEQKLIEVYHNTPIRMDSLQARALSNMKMYELTIEEYEKYCKLKEDLTNELNNLEEMLKVENGIDKEIIAEMREILKKYGTPRRSNVVPPEISVSNEVEGMCILQLSSDGMILRKQGTNAEEEPIPTDSNGYACLVNNDASFILIDDRGYHSFIKVSEIPLDVEVPVNRYGKKALAGKIVAMLPFDIESNKCCTLISKKGIIKRIKISEMTPTNKPCIALDSDDALVKGIVLSIKSHKELLVYTNNGMGQRFDPNGIRITSPNAKGGSGFNLAKDDEIVGCYAISPESNQFLLYCTQKAKTRLNNIEFLPTRDSKHDKMVQLIELNDRDKLISVLGCNKLDTACIYFDDDKSEKLKIKTLEESTMSTKPKKSINKDMKTAKVVKVRII